LFRFSQCANEYGKKENADIKCSCNPRGLLTRRDTSEETAAIHRGEKSENNRYRKGPENFWKPVSESVFFEEREQEGERKKK
jgi:hypothetical protein